MKAWRDDYSNHRVREVVDEYIHSVRDRALILDNLVDGMSYDELAGKYSLAYESVRDVMRKGKEALDRHYDTA